MVKEIQIFPGQDKSGKKETFDCISIYKGDVVGIVGPTGSGKSALIEDIEQLANGDTSTKRKIRINGKIPDAALRFNPKEKLVAQLSQNMNFLADMSVEDFLLLHAKCRGKDKSLVEKVIDNANQLTGEPIHKGMNLTILSGGQSRSLMVADVALISNSPIVLIDEIENAGIKKHEALKLLSGNGKIILVVTHDPVLALLTKWRIVMKNGAVEKIAKTTSHEFELSCQLNLIDHELFKIREKVRYGEVLTDNFPFVFDNLISAPLFAD
ncbi:MAG: ATP-binding cassette domain-containing protein [Mariniphaga sp.]|nr:ATP-binding cassette domain-containing protein [Mariniphaga sp.]